jgi:hypothetical protein
MNKASAIEFMDMLMRNPKSLKQQVMDIRYLLAYKYSEGLTYSGHKPKFRPLKIPKDEPLLKDLAKLTKQLKEKEDEDSI